MCFLYNLYSEILYQKYDIDNFIFKKLNQNILYI